MKILESKQLANVELPMQLFISFEKVFKLFQKYAHKDNKEHPFHKSAIVFLDELEKYPDLSNGFSDNSLLYRYHEQINTLLQPLFPEALLDNEIKAATVPFSFTSFKFSNRFKNILKNAGDNFEFKVRNFEDDITYIAACSFILGHVYGVNVDLKRPFYFDIPNKNTGTIKYYRANINADFSEITATERAPKLTKKDFEELLDNFNNVDLWKEKFPPNSYIFKGFGIINLFDVTSEEMTSSIKANLLSRDVDLIEKLENNIRDFYGIKDLKLGYSLFDKIHYKLHEALINNSNSIILKGVEEIKCSDGYFCNGLLDKVFVKNEIFVISDLEKYGTFTKQNQFYKNLKKEGISSIGLIPIKANKNGDLALIEIASPRAYDLNSVNITKLKDIIPVFEAAVKRSAEEKQNVLEATIQENYTSIHNSVKWRFYESAAKYHAEKTNNEDAKLDDIVFKNVFPLFGQSDIKGSSSARNKAIQEDLVTQLTLAISVLKEACNEENLPIYRELMFRVETYLNDVKNGLHAGDEISILDFLKREIYPVFNHIKTLSSKLLDKVAVYMNSIDENLHVVYDKRKKYEDSVTHLNDKLASFLDKKQVEAQKMFPHYFERYKTDGVEYNLYIGQSITKEKKFDPIYLYNLRLWQLSVTCEMENIAFFERENMSYDLRVASLILVQSSEMAIRFRMDEKQFDVDGAYNIRYEIIKKRIDKAHIKGTEERLTSVGKIAIVYSQEKDEIEYLKYITYLQSKNILGAVEHLELEDLQGVSGLKALRVEVIFKKNYQKNISITYNDLLKEIES